MKRLVGYILVIVLFLSVSAPYAYSSVTPGIKCPKAGVKQIYQGKTFTCIKSGKKLVWNKGKKVVPISKPSEQAKEIDYSRCLEESKYETWRLATSEYSNTARDFSDLFSARLENNDTKPQFGYEDLSFTNKTPCKVKIQISAKLQCYGPIGSQAYSYDLQSQTGDVQVSANSAIAINVEKFFSSSKYSCESKPSQFYSLGMRNRLSGPPFLNFGYSVANITIRIEGADPVKPYKEVTTPTPTPTPIPTTKNVLTCAQGGLCAIGDVGPGGGLVFYIAQNTFSSPGSDCGNNCRYMETIGNISTDRMGWCSDDAPLIGTSDEFIGSGMSNTNRAARVCTSGAIKSAADYIQNGKTDWHLPSKGELTELLNESPYLRGSDDWKLPIWSSTEVNVNYVLALSGRPAYFYPAWKGGTKDNILVVRAF